MERRGGRHPGLLLNSSHSPIGMGGGGLSLSFHRFPPTGIMGNYLYNLLICTMNRILEAYVIYGLAVIVLTVLIEIRERRR